MSADAYEQQHMAGGEVLLRLRQKAIVPRWALGLIAGLPAVAGAVVGAALAAVGAVGGLAALGIGLAGLAGGLLPAGITFLFAVGRLVITTEELHLQIGIAGPRIPIESIATVEVGRSRSRNKGLGYRKLLDGTRIYNLMGDRRRAVKLTFADGSSPMNLVCENPDAVAEAIQTAMARKGAKVRVAVEEDAPVEVPVEVPAEREHEA